MAGNHVQLPAWATEHKEVIMVYLPLVVMNLYLNKKMKVGYYNYQQQIHHNQKVIMENIFMKVNVNHVRKQCGKE